MIIHERFYTIRELERLTGLNYHTLLRRLRNVKGVLNLGVRKNVIPRVPESVWVRELEKWSNGGRL